MAKRYMEGVLAIRLETIGAVADELIVAGDAQVIAPMLSHFGEVRVVDPTRNFDRVRTLPMDANAALEVPRQEGR